MNNELTWHFDLAVIEWLLILALLVVLGFAGALLTRKYINQKQKNTSSADSDSLTKNWHSENFRISIRISGSFNNWFIQRTGQKQTSPGMDQISWQKQKPADRWFDLSTSSTMCLSTF